MATYSTFQELIEKTILELRMETGQSVQQYAEDVIAAKLQRAFNLYFDKYWWPEYVTHGEEMPLNGTTGKVTTDLSAKIKRWNDVYAIWYETEAKPLQRKPIWINPASITGGLTKYWEPTNNSDDKIFRVLPITTTGDLYVTYRTYPGAFASDDSVKMDNDLLLAKACIDYVADDGETELGVKKWDQTVQDRERILRETLNAGPIPFGSSKYNPMTEWMTNP